MSGVEDKDFGLSLTSCFHIDPPRTSAVVHNILKNPHSPTIYINLQMEKLVSYLTDASLSSQCDKAKQTLYDSHMLWV